MKNYLVFSLSLLLLACSPNIPTDPHLSSGQNATTNNNTKVSEPETSIESSPQEIENTAPESANSTFRYTGVTQDLVPAAIGGGPDGKGDHSFELSTQFENEVSIKDVTISRIENGQANGVAGWTTSSTRQYWILKVRANGTELNGSQKALDLKQALSGRVQFEFYGSDAPGFDLAAAGTAYELQITYRDTDNTEQSLSYRVTL